MDLVSLTYISRAAPSLTTSDVDQIHRTAITYNPLDGVTGLLVYNGVGFMQIIEGGETAIDSLAERIAGDPRHRDFTVRDRRIVKQRAFPDWTMERVDVDGDYDRGRAQVGERLTRRLDPEMMRIVGESLAAISTVD